MSYFTRGGGIMPNAYRRTPKFCEPAKREDFRMKVSADAAHVLLSLPKYTGLGAMELIERANTRLRVRKATKLIEPKDAATAIAILEGIL